MTRHAPALACLLVLASFLPPPARALMLSDSTSVLAFRLANGLEVRVRDVPGAKSVAMSLAYRAGKWIEPAGQPDLADVLAQVQFTAPVGDVPERPIPEMASVRPLGWGVTTNPHLAVLTEVSAAATFPGVLHEVAARARGVQLDDSCLAHVLAGVRRNVGERRFGNVDAALYERVHDLALGRDEAQALERSRGTGLARLTTARVDSLLRRYYVASNASLALAGDFSRLDVRALVEREFGAVPAGSAQPDPTAERLKPGTRVSLMDHLATPVSVVGLISPAIEDTLHPAYFFNSLLVGGWWTRQHKESASRLESFFQYSLLDQPELARFDAEIAPERADAAAQAKAYYDVMEEYAQLAVTGDVRDVLRASVRWLMGGALAESQRRQAADSPSFLSLIATTTATRAIWKGDAFWAGYLARFERANFGPNSFLRWMTDPAHEVVLVLEPRSLTPGSPR